MMLSLIFPFLLVASPDLPGAQQAYEEARYEEALASLGGGCAEATAPGECERLLALVQIAMGNEAEARTAFVRLLAIEPNVSLGSEVAPKVQSFFAATKRAIADLEALELEPVVVSESGGPWPLRVAAPALEAVEAISAELSLPGRDGLQSVALVREGDAFVGVVEAEVEEEEGVAYFLVATLAGGSQVFSGSEASPRPLSLSRIGAIAPGDGGSSPFGELAVEEEASVPPWAIWAMVGGGVAVALSVTLAVLLSGDEEPGSVSVAVTLRELP